MDKQQFEENEHNHLNSSINSQQDTIDTNDPHKLEKQIGEQAIQQAQSSRKGFFSVLSVLCILLVVVAFIFTSKPVVDMSEPAREAYVNGYSETLTAGTVLATKDASGQPRDYIVTFPVSEAQKQHAIATGGGQPYKILVWDYAAEDGDYVQIFQNGIPITDPFMITNKPKEVAVDISVTGSTVIQVKGIRDGVGGITYALKPIDKATTYYNNAPIDGMNTYTFTPFIP